MKCEAAGARRRRWVAGSACRNGVTERCTKRTRGGRARFAVSTCTCSRIRARATSISPTGSGSPCGMGLGAPTPSAFTSNSRTASPLPLARVSHYLYAHDKPGGEPKGERHEKGWQQSLQRWDGQTVRAMAAMPESCTCVLRHHIQAPNSPSKSCCAAV